MNYWLAVLLISFSPFNFFPGTSSSSHWLAKQKGGRCSSNSENVHFHQALKSKQQAKKTPNLVFFPFDNFFHLSNSRLTGRLKPIQAVTGQEVGYMLDRSPVCLRQNTERTIIYTHVQRLESCKQQLKVLSWNSQLYAERLWWNYHEADKILYE